MKSIMSINYKFFSMRPKELVEFCLANSSSLDGFEISVNYNSLIEKNYMLELANLCKKNNLHFQVHGDTNKSISDQLKFINILYFIYDILGYPITLVLHPLSASNIDGAKQRTRDYFNELLELVDNNKILVTIENLNDFENDDRLNKDDITDIICNDERLFFTYDIGHELSEFGNTSEMFKDLIPLIRNVHIHTVNTEYDGGYDHKPIIKNDPKWNDILKGLLFLKMNRYNGPITFEYNLYSCPGELIEDKIIYYLKSIDFVSERFK